MGLLLIGTIGIGVAVLLVKMLTPRPKAAPFQAAVVSLLWGAWFWMTRIPQTADGWAMHALVSSNLGLYLIAAWLTLIPVLLVASVLHVRYFWHCLRG